MIGRGQVLLSARARCRVGPGVDAAMRCNLSLLVVWLFGLSVGTWLMSGPAVADEAASEQQPEVITSQYAEMVQRIDTLIRQRWEQDQIQPAATVGDGEFLRRAHLDLNGVIPRISEVRKFLADEQPDKRQRLVNQLVSSPRFATHMATVWRNRILPPGAEEMHAREAAGLQKWLRTRFARNQRYDSLVASLLLATEAEELGPALYFQANDLTPEKLAASVSDLFLGIKLQCAQCHDHPYAEFSQTDFWGLAAFFAQVQAQDNRGMGMVYRLVDANRGEVRLPDLEVVVAPKYLLSETTVDGSFGSRRASFVFWLTSRDNPFFARAGVNWAWSHLFGEGLVESIAENTKEGDIAKGDAAHYNTNNRQLLEELTDYFVASGFDMQTLIRTIAISQAYQLSSWEKLPENAASNDFAHMLPKPLTPEQLYDSFLLLSPRVPLDRVPSIGAAAGAAAFAPDPLRVQFVRRMREPPGSATEFRAGTLQALMLMNGVITAELTAHERSRLLGALTAPYMNDEDRIDALFLATLCRQPDRDERAIGLAALAESKGDAERSRALSDLLWALVNSTEFAFNR